MAFAEGGSADLAPQLVVICAGEISPVFRVQQLRHKYWVVQKRRAVACRLRCQRRALSEQ